MKSFGVLLSATLALSAPPDKLPDLPDQYTAFFVSGATKTQQYSDETAKKFATFAAGSSGTIFSVTDCVAKLTYSNAPAFPGLPAGKCTLKPPSPYYDASGCPSQFAPNWGPPTAVDFYSSYKGLMTYKDQMDCPASSGQCWRYYYLYPPPSVSNNYTSDPNGNTFEYFIRADTQLPDSGTIVYSGVSYKHTFINNTVDPAKLGRPDGCPDPSGACDICFAGACGPCQACVGQPKTGQCAPCWAPDAASGYSCMSDTPGKDLCTKCWEPAAPTPAPPAPTPAAAPTSADTCSGSCSALGITGACCPTATGSWLDCCDHQPSCDANPICAAQGIEGDCCPTSKGVNLACCFSSPPTPSGPAPTPADQCAICNGSGQCAACTQCESLKTGPCAPCWADNSGFSCLPYCQDSCWK